MHKTHFSDELIEALLVFAAFFLPGYLFQTASFSPTSLADPTYVSGYLIVAAPQIAFISYLMVRRNQPAEYGFRRLVFRDIGPGLAAVAALLALAILLSLVSPTSEPTAFTLRGASVVLVIGASLTTGYREELFFRSLMFRALVHQGVSFHVSVAITSLVFAAGHLYQGALAFFGALGVAVFLQWHFTRYRSVHIIALVHAAYNSAIVAGLSMS